MSSTSGFGDASDQRFSASRSALLGPNSARMPDQCLARKSSPNADRASEPSAESTTRIASTMSSRAVRASSTVVYTQP